MAFHLLEQLLIQEAALCWLKLNLVELSYFSKMAQSIALTCVLAYLHRSSTPNHDRFSELRLY